MAKRKIRLILEIGPTGFMGCDRISKAAVHFTNKKQNKDDLLCRIKAEGNALSFVLEESCLTQAFADAIEDGRFLKDANERWWYLHCEHIPEAILEAMAEWQSD